MASFLPPMKTFGICVAIVLTIGCGKADDKPTFAVAADDPLPCSEVPDKWQFPCGDGTCVLGTGFKYSRVCDSYIDCFTGADEVNCLSQHKKNCREDAKYRDLFECDDGMCIDKKLANDGKLNCVDKSDENLNEVIRDDLQQRDMTQKKFTSGRFLNIQMSTDTGDDLAHAPVSDDVQGNYSGSNEV